jgi:hypothetical protein
VEIGLPQQQLCGGTGSGRAHYHFMEWCLILVGSMHSKLEWSWSTLAFCCFNLRDYNQGFFLQLGVDENLANFSKNLAKLIEFTLEKRF